MSGPDPLRGRRLRFELRELALVGAGAIPGALLRWQAGVRLAPGLGGGMDGTAAAHLLVNLAGSLLLGVLAGPIPWRTPLLLLLGIGFCGSLTTFSSWMLDLVELQRRGDGWAALGQAALSLVLGLTAAALGYGLSLWLLPRLRHWHRRRRGASLRPPGPPRSRT
ncbi:CrcB family protein [Synechococcus sp. 1G10]|uniref:fluoride efflux transporter FluC n=1 Tax=Synechococcus sp. 1G10 TaxID=2025605 RepID=UPI000B996C05|nr:CrcB family protein [Synechococcus sp. 1G10]